MEARIKAMEEITQRHDDIIKQCRADCIKRDAQLAKGDDLFVKMQGHMDIMDYNINAVSEVVERLMERLEDFLELLDGIEVIGKGIRLVKKFTLAAGALVTAAWLLITRWPEVLEAIKKWLS